ncbi:hypothetical protein GYB57_13435 [bacterium]|nr:hypothetical protein [bacterium]
MKESDFNVLIFMIASWVILSALATYRLAKSPKHKLSKIRVIFIWSFPYFAALLFIVLTSKAKDKKVDDRNRYREAGYKAYTRFR